MFKLLPIAKYVLETLVYVIVFKSLEKSWIALKARRA